MCSWESFPPELAEIATACNVESDAEPAPQELLVSWLRELDALLDGLAVDGGAGLLAEYLDRSATVGMRVRVDLHDRSFECDATGIDDDGHLVVTRDDGTAEIVTAGDVVNLRAR